MSVVRMNIIIPEELAHQLDKLVGRKKNAWSIGSGVN